MAIPLTGSDGLFTILGKFIFSLDTLNIASGTTVPAETLDALNQYRLKVPTDLDFDQKVQALADADAQWRQSGETYTSQIRNNTEGLVIAFVLEDAPQPDQTLDNALRYLIDDIVAQDSRVDANLVSVVVAADAGNTTSDLTIAVDKIRGG